MNVTQTRHVDSSEEGGYLYEYDLYKFVKAGEVLYARSYTDDEGVHFLRKVQKNRTATLEESDFESPLVKEAIDHLERSGFTDIQYLSAWGSHPIPRMD